MAWGSGAAVVMRIVLTVVAVELLRLPYLKLVGAALLLWIAVQLLIPEEEGHGGEAASTSLAAAIKTILLADLVMSLDNVIAVAAAAKGNTVLLVIGLAISIPLVVFASRMLLVLMDRFPVIITLGAALLGWVAGDMAVTDPIDKPWVDLNAAFLHWGAPLAGAVVRGRGRQVARRPHPGPARRCDGRRSTIVPASVTDPFRRSCSPSTDRRRPSRRRRRVIALRQQLRERDIQVHLINVQRPLPGDVTSFVGGKTGRGVPPRAQRRGPGAGPRPARVRGRPVRGAPCWSASRDRRSPGWRTRPAAT